jgi:hypothetical protein
MNFDNISSAMMLIFDELKNDPASKKLIKQIDEAEGDPDLKKGMQAGIKRLKELDKHTLAADIEAKLKGWI